MGRRRYEQKQEAAERWPLLSNLLGCYFNQDFTILYGSADQAMALAVAEGDLDYRRAILREWRDWQATEGAVEDIRPSLDDRFSVCVRFDQPGDARLFMNRLYDGIIERVRAETRTPKPRYKD